MFLQSRRCPPRETLICHLKGGTLKAEDVLRVLLHAGIYFLASLQKGRISLVKRTAQHLFRLSPTTLEISSRTVRTLDCIHSARDLSGPFMRCRR